VVPTLGYQGERRGSAGKEVTSGKPKMKAEHVKKKNKTRTADRYLERDNRQGGAKQQRGYERKGKWILTSARMKKVKNKKRGKNAGVTKKPGQKRGEYVRKRQEDIDNAAEDRARGGEKKKGKAREKEIRFRGLSDSDGVRTDTQRELTKLNAMGNLFNTKERNMNRGRTVPGFRRRKSKKKKGLVTQKEEKEGTVFSERRSNTKSQDVKKKGKRGEKKKKAPQHLRLTQDPRGQREGLVKKGKLKKHEVNDGKRLEKAVAPQAKKKTKGIKKKRKKKNIEEEKKKKKKEGHFFVSEGWSESPRCLTFQHKGKKKFKRGGKGKHIPRRDRASEGPSSFVWALGEKTAISQRAGL